MALVLENVKVGDKLIVTNHYGDRIDTVERITSTLVITKIHRFRKTDGYESGQSAYACGLSRARLATDEEVNRVNEKTRRNMLSAKCKGIRFERLTIQQLESILKIAEGAE